jgi:hypothetical protein
MIHCPDCGTLNRRGSTYCSNCGHDLHAAPDITCTECNRVSPPDSAYCQWCGAALASARHGDSAMSSPLEALSEPKAAERPRPPDRELPQWLYESADAQPDQPVLVGSTSLAVPYSGAAKNKYLEGIENTLRATDAWQVASQSAAPGGADAAEDAGRESRRPFGCLVMGMTVLTRVIALGAQRSL